MKIYVDQVAEVFVLETALHLEWVVIVALHHGLGQLFVVLSLAKLPA